MSISISSEGIKKAEKLLGHIPKAVETAVSNAVNRAALAGRTGAVKKSKEEYEVKTSTVRGAIRIIKARPSRHAQAVIRAQGKPIPLIKFKVSPGNTPRRQPKVYKVAVKKNGMKDVPGVFVARMKNNHLGVFQREGKSRIPIEKKYGPSIPQMLKSDSVSEYVEERAVEVLESRLENEIKRALGGIK